MSSIPLLSGPPPQMPTSEIACRRCNKEFNLIFARARKCNHCGYSYCSSCTDFQALMPRTESDGYHPVNVCAYCIDFLNMTAMDRSGLKLLSVPKLREYLSVYNINTGHAVEKEEIINAIIHARARNGCLPRIHEDYYRRHSVPKGNRSRPRGFFSRPQEPPPPTPPRPIPHSTRPFPRPDLSGSYTRNPPPVPPRPNTGPPPTYLQSRPAQPPRGGNFPYSRPAEARSATHLPHTNAQPNTPRPRTTSATPTPARPPAPPPPTLDELLNMSAAAIGTLSVHALKDILFINHVPVQERLVLEKADLVNKVIDLVTEERRHRERRRAMEEQEEQERLERQRELHEQFQRERDARVRAAAANDAEGQTTAAPNDESITRDGDDVDTTPGHESIPPAGSEQQDNHGMQVDDQEEVQRSTTPLAIPTSTSPKPPSPPSKSPAPMHRDGMCVVCQDDEANIAIVDCGHLAMCRDCADLIMASSRECPLCRTRIVTEARLLRIYRT